MNDLRRRNRKVLLMALGFAAGMIALAYASVPLYRMICQVTGWGGTTQMVDANPYEGKKFDREVQVLFNTDVAQNMPWTFKPDIRGTRVKVGQDGVISFRAVNNSDVALTGTAVYNVTPLRAGKYFYKTQCFCFGEQTIKAGDAVNMPVTFFIDPAFAEDPEMKNIKTITLSYTFFRHNSPELEKAMEKFYNDSTDKNLN